MEIYLQDANDILVNLNGKRAYLEDNSLWVYDVASTDSADAAMEFNKTDLGEPSIDKLINYFDIDYTGQFTLYLYYDNGSLAWSTIVTDHAQVRDTEYVYVPLISRQAFQKMFFVIVSSDADTKIYNLEIDFQILKRRRFE